MSSTKPSPRLIVPDAARGLALLGIALANISTAWAPPSTDLPADFLGGVVNNSAADKVVALVTAVIAHSRGLPMFSTLLGFGVGLIVMSLWRRQFPLERTRRIIVRRYFFLSVFGLLHGLLLFYGDIMFFYGLCGMLLALMITLKDKTLTIIAWILLGLGLALGSIFSVGMYWAPANSLTMNNSHEPALHYGETLLNNLSLFGLQTVSVPLFLIMYFPVMIIGFVWARTGVLTDVEAHRGLLVRWTVVAAVVAVGVGVPWGLAEIGVIGGPWAQMLLSFNMYAGVLTGPGILAGLALMTWGVQKRLSAGERDAVPMLLRVPAALGKRSMSGYLMQSVLLFIIVQPYLLGAGWDVGAAPLALIAVVVWLITLALAWVWETRNWPGPFEWAHRRLAYGSTGQAQLTRGA